MPQRCSLRHAVAVGFLLLSPGLGNDVFAGEAAAIHRPPDRAAMAVVEELKSFSEGQVSARWDPLTGRIRSLSGRFSLGASRNMVAACLEFADEHKKLFGLDPSVVLVPTSQKEGLGTYHLRFRSTVGGVPVAGGEVAFHLERSQTEVVLVALTSRLPRSVGLSRVGLTPAFDEAAARTIAEQEIAGSLRAPSRSTLEILARYGNPRLVYTIHVDSLSPRGLFKVRLDAHSGEILSIGNLTAFGEPPDLRDGKGKVFLVNPIVALRDRSLTDLDGPRRRRPPGGLHRSHTARS